jgi:N,N'-diacetyllegionaminate synthase
MQIGPKKVGIPSAPCFIIAEVAQAHDGSLGTAHSFIDAIADSGADAVKFQTHIASAESTLDEPFRINFSLQDKTRYEYWKRLEFSFKEWSGLADHAQRRGLIFLSSPFSVQAVHLLKELDIVAWKVGSGEIRSKDLLNEMIISNRPILISTGMSSWGEIDDTVNYLNENNVSFALLQCTSKYPTKLSEVGLNVLNEFRSRYSLPVGLSDHSGSPFPAIAAIARGCDILEMHVTFDRRMFGPDVSSSVTFDELKMICQFRDSLLEIDSMQVDKNIVARDLFAMREAFGKSLALAINQKKGTVITQEMLSYKKPATGIPLSRVKDVVGKVLKRDVSSDQLLKWDDLHDQ